VATLDQREHPVNPVLYHSATACARPVFTNKLRPAVRDRVLINNSKNVRQSLDIELVKSP